MYLSKTACSQLRAVAGDWLSTADLSICAANGYKHTFSLFMFVVKLCDFLYALNYFFLICV